MADTSILNDITQIATAIGVILTAISSISNRWKLGTVENKVDKAVTVAAETKAEAAKVNGFVADKVDEVKAAVLETKEAAIAVNAEVVQQVHDAGVAAGKEIAANGANHG